ncbi:hypothetical protein GON01_16465 [Sphingomonas sp. MAH-20]|uniref:Sarcosine oxidase subunit alpha n=1 Tax=Sphingomonas horti TaxID=2682842 RepID=A0A6I4J573_9SPHN|nr:glycine cleavage T C-terminal barrel domain-containing protein [Sphingomonas sp. CGMCC 1.13658]MBA2921014.1 hypothetical protein [Sphingomonas sp. CGMCC 1.13658]MVO79527.1 hypothetical protein [Sphingomonas horti]
MALPVGPEDRAFVDFQNDVTVADIRLAAQENFVSVEHLKRYTTLGMAVDQGKTSSVTAIALMGQMTGRPPGDVGTTGFRPPYTPTALSALRGLGRGAAYAPFKRSSLHDRHEQLRASFEDYGGWTRPAHYLRQGEDRDAAMRREALAVRHRAGLFDATPLGKIEVSGPDAGMFLDRIYANRMSNLAVGRVRYGMMLSEFGVIVDDGVVARMADDRFLVGSTSGGADRVAAILEEWLQCEWRDLSVIVAPVTTCWGNVTLAGPNARKILDRARCDIPLDNESFPHLSWREASVAGLNARIARVSFSGELSYEISVDWNRTPGLWDSLAQAAEPFGGAEPVGIDAWMLLRLEKGFLHVGADTEGTTVPDDVSWTKVAARAGDFIGKRSLLWAVNREPGRLQLVGLEAVDGRTVPPVGAHFASDDHRFRTSGFVTSSEFSPILDRPVALALVRGGRNRLGEVLHLLRSGDAYRKVQPCFYDQSGERMNG